MSILRDREVDPVFMYLILINIRMCSLGTYNKWF